MNLLHILAEAAATQPTEPAPWWANPAQFLLPLLVIMIVFMFMSSSKGKKNEQRARDEMLKNLKRGDRVSTVGGILGTVVDVRDNEVVLKVDESANTKIRFSRDAIKRVVEQETAAATAK